MSGLINANIVELTLQENRPFQANKGNKNQWNETLKGCGFGTLDKKSITLPRFLI